MGKEAKIGVAVILGLLAVLGVIVGVRVASLGGNTDPDFAVEEPDTANAESAVSVQPGVAVSSNPLATAGKPASSPSTAKPATSKKPIVLAPEHPEPPASGAAPWRQLAIQDANSETVGTSEAGSGLSYMPPPSPNDPHGRSGNAYPAPPPADVSAGDASAGYALAGEAVAGVQSYDPSRGGRFNTTTAGSGQGSDSNPAGQPTYMPRQDLGAAYAAQPMGNAGGLPQSDPAAGRRSDGSYEVQPNDSFWTISEKLYGTGAYFRALAEYNGGKVANQNQLQVGQVIATPDVAELEQKHAALCPKPEHRYVARHHTTISRVGQHGDNATYTVAEGDSLYRIARYELGDASRWHEIYKLNREVIGESFNHLRPGTQLVLPGTGNSEPTDTLTRRPSSLY